MRVLSVGRTLVSLSLCVAATVAYGQDRPSEEQSVRPGINDTFVDPTLDVSEWLGRFEIESREVYSARNEVLKVCEIDPGDRVADIGAGTGFYTRLFAEAVGDSGWVYAVDIAPPFLRHIQEQAAEEGLDNLTTVLCSPRSIVLPPHVRAMIDGGEPLEFGHTLQSQIGGQLDAGFVLIGFFEDRYHDELNDPLTRYMDTFIATRSRKE